jgi:hypothetical protein
MKMTTLYLEQVRDGWPDAYDQLRMDDDRADEYTFSVEDGKLWAESPVPSDAIFWNGNYWCEQD